MTFSDLLAKPYQSPADVFFSLYEYASLLSTYQRTTADPCNDLKVRFGFALVLDYGKDAAANIISVLRSVQGDTHQRKYGAVMCALTHIDGFFLRIHPRTGSLGGLDIPAWLSDCAEARISSGSYLETERWSLIPRGPIARVPRAQFSSGGELFSDYFCALSVVSRNFRLGMRDISVKHEVIAIGGLHGFTVEKAGSEKVTFVPVAIEPEDLTLTGSAIGEQGFVECRVAVDSAEVIASTIAEVGRVDILLAPELTVDEAAAEKIAEFLRLAPHSCPRLVISGSGATVAQSSDGLPWNQAVALNENGVVLWRQSKTWTSGFTRDRAEQYGLGNALGDFLLEKNAESDQVTIADIDGFGRCCVLICQDIQARPLADDLIAAYQPDWVFVPVLDQGVQAGRWAHQRVFDLSSVSNARYVIASSLSLVKRPAAEFPPIGLAIGPKSAAEERADLERAFCEVHLTGASSNSSTIIWRDPGWRKTSVRGDG